MLFNILSFLLIVYSQYTHHFANGIPLFETISQNNIQVVQKDNTRSFELIGTDYLLLLHNNVLKIYDKKKGKIFNWIKILDKNKFFPTLENKDSHGNKFISLTIQNGTLFATIVDTNGGGSGEGIETVLEFGRNGRRYISKCFDYNNYGQFEGDESIIDPYSRGTTQFDQLKKLPLSKCKDNIIIL